MNRSSVKIPPGVDNGSRLKLRSEGEAGYGGGPQGDLYVVIHVKEHEMFVRQDNDVIIEVPISFPQAAVGTEIEVPTLDGKVKLKIPAGTQSGKILRLKGKGIVDLHGYGRGDQLVKVIVETPRQPDRAPARTARGIRQARRRGRQPSAVQGLRRQAQRDVRLIRRVVAPSSRSRFYFAFPLLFPSDAIFRTPDVARGRTDWGRS